ncbi:hypothetical protein V8C43DRAFT_281998 [Trichoderma afarasin]
MLFDDELRGVLRCPSCLVLRRNPIKHTQPIKRAIKTSPSVNPVRSKFQIPGSGWKFPRQTLKARERGLFLLMAVCLSCLGLSNLLRPACSTYCTVQMQRGRSWGFQVRFLFFLPLQLSCRLACAVAARRAADDRGLEELEREAGQ